jgi:type II secretory pathway pseudopilin PulG
MKRSTIIVVTVIVAVLVGLGVLSQRPADYTSYHKAALSSAEEALSAVRSLRLAVDASQQGRTLPTVLKNVIDDSRTAATTAVQQLGDQEVPDERSARLRDEVSPLLAETVSEISETARAIDSDDTALLHRSSDRLGAIGDKLDDFVKRHQA